MLKYLANIAIDSHPIFKAAAGVIGMGLAWVYDKLYALEAWVKLLTLYLGLAVVVLSGISWFFSARREYKHRNDPPKDGEGK